ncbi:tyrosine-type recombinase/integrase [Streptomyces sp. ADI95-16]|uniref:tyrosine-type recombinase/integrase n=1 Tax=Streptomyces sp. ADI95-16 TaxID=1522758 RepID=UPI0020B46061|nr:tyrosine-type recombinase/integrase [Streptomyces sp. ADI95-16]
MSANKLRPKRVVRRRHPKLPPEGTRESLLADFKTARDRMVVTWLDDGGFRIGELTGMHLIDLHLRENARCGECRSAHVHICHRETNANRSRVKTKQDWVVQDGVVQGGAIRRASSAMVHTYFDYMTTEYPSQVTHGMFLVNLSGPTAGLPWSTDSARKLLRRAGYRLDLGLVRPHMFRHQFGSDVLDAAGGNAVIARDAGGWASAQTVEEVYGHTDVHDPAFVTALNTVWGEPS